MTKVQLIVADQKTGKEVYLRPGDVTHPDVSSDNVTGKRELKRRDTVVDVDISSPEVTILDKQFGEWIQRQRHRDRDTDSKRQDRETKREPEG